jgi:GrpB-like predicted nucleotidyltransferase (UPF0157 family)
MVDIVVIDADPEWPVQFREIANYLVPIIGSSIVRIEHVGSTAVSGLAAKPIIDIDVVVAEEDDVPVVLGLIESAGYRWIGDLDVEGREAFEPTSAPTFAAHHLYLVVEDNRAHSDQWLLRDALSDSPDLIERYGHLKRQNVALSNGDADRYTALKAAFVADVLAEARRSRGMVPVEYWKPDLE